MSDDDDRPMTRTELAMLWDGLGRWMASHPLLHDWPAPEAVQRAVDRELTDRFGG